MRHAQVVITLVGWLTLSCSGDSGGDPMDFIGLYDGTYTWDVSTGLEKTSYSAQGKLNVKLCATNPCVVLNVLVCKGEDDKLGEGTGILFDPTGADRLKADIGPCVYEYKGRLFAGLVSKDTSVATLQGNQLSMQMSVAMEHSASGDTLHLFINFVGSRAAGGGV